MCCYVALKKTDIRLMNIVYENSRSIGDNESMPDITTGFEFRYMIGRTKLYTYCFSFSTNLSLPLELQNDLRNVIVAKRSLLLLFLHTFQIHSNEET